MPADPADHQVGVQLRRVGLDERPGGGPVAQRLEDRPQVMAGRRQAVLGGVPPLAVADDEADPLQMAQALTNQLQAEKKPATTGSR